MTRVALRTASGKALPLSRKFLRRHTDVPVTSSLEPGLTCIAVASWSAADIGITRVLPGRIPKFYLLLQLNYSSLQPFKTHLGGYSYNLISYCSLLCRCGNMHKRSLYRRMWRPCENPDQRYI